ncbi:unnamed protein product [Lampetra fluviatilis]
MSPSTVEWSHGDDDRVESVSRSHPSEEQRSDPDSDPSRDGPEPAPCRHKPAVECAGHRRQSPRSSSKPARSARQRRRGNVRDDDEEEEDAAAAPVGTRASAGRDGSHAPLASSRASSSARCFDKTQAAAARPDIEACTSL